MHNAYRFLVSFLSSALVGGIILFAWAARPVHLGASSQQVPASAPNLSNDEAKALKSPIPFSNNSISRGRLVYASLGCNACHGNDGKALIEVVANATDLTNPSVWKSGTEEGFIYRSIRDGAGLSMPPFKTEVNEQQDIWHLVNFIRSLWPEAQRPAKVASHRLPVPEHAF
jgi:mono/diheme cytochrome c family protein